MGNNRSIPFLNLQEHQKYTGLFNENFSVAVKKSGGGVYQTGDSVRS
jgi:hypothetical protein